MSAVYSKSVLPGEFLEGEKSMDEIKKKHNGSEPTKRDDATAIVLSIWSRRTKFYPKSVTKKNYIRSLLEKNLLNVWSGNLHKFCKNILKKFQ